MTDNKLRVQVGSFKIENAETDGKNIYAQFAFSDERSVGANGSGFYPSAFMHQNGMGLAFIREHGWNSDVTLGAGNVNVGGATGEFVGVLHNTPTADEFAIEYNGLKDKGVGAVSIAFYVDSNYIRMGDKLTDEEREWGAEIWFDKGDLAELSFVLNPNIEAANLLINSLQTDVSNGMNGLSGTDETTTESGIHIVRNEVLREAVQQRYRR